MTAPGAHQIAVVHISRSRPHRHPSDWHHRRVPSSDPPPPALHRAALLAAGITDDEIRTSQRQGTWERLHRGVYAPSESLARLSASNRYRLRAVAVAQRSPHLVLSHVSAAAVLGLPLWDVALDHVHLTRIGRGGSLRGPGRIVHAGNLVPQNISVVSGVRVTSIGRTLIDLGCSTSFETTVIAADHALGRYISPSALGAELTDLRQRRGASRARRSIAFADGRSESPGESRTRMALAGSGLPDPTLQVSVHTPGGIFLGRSDLGYPDQGVLVEFDGRVKYLELLRPGQRPEDVVADEKRREDNLRAMGFIVTRFVWDDLRDPAGMCARVARDIDRARGIVAAGGIIGRWSAATPLRLPS